MSKIINNFYIYIYLDQNNIPFYVGKGKGYRFSIKMHLHRSCVNKFLKNKILKVGKENVKIKFLYTDLTEEEAFEREEYWISYYGRRDLGKGTLCNLSDGGDGGSSGRIWTKETRQKLSESHKGKPTWNKGLKTGPVSEEIRTKHRKPHGPKNGISYGRQYQKYLDRKR